MRFFRRFTCSILALLLCSISVTQSSTWRPHQSPVPLRLRPLQYRTDPQHQQHRQEVRLQAVERYSTLRAGNTAQVSAVASTVTSILQIAFDVITTACKILLPPLTAAGKAVYACYRTLPKDLILAQIGLVYCFAGGYFPTLFSTLQAAQHSGLAIMFAALGDLIDEGAQAVEAIQERQKRNRNPLTPRQAFQQSTAVVLSTIDPIKINHATSSLYTTWMGISAVLEKEYAKTISMSLSMSAAVLPIATKLLSPPLFLVVPDNYHQWVPVVVGWTCKAAAMSIAWRIERVLTASTSALTGGVLFARAVLRMTLHTDTDDSRLDESIGLVVASLGLYSQIGDGFDFTIPFPLTLVTWPFQIAENWIQWQITKEAT